MENNYKFFCLNNLAIESAVREVQTKIGVDLGPTHSESAADEKKYYPQFSEKIRSEAERMAQSYVIFYSLENSIRELISDILKKHGADWWNIPDIVPKPVKENAEKTEIENEELALLPDQTICWITQNLVS